MNTRQLSLRTILVVASIFVFAACTEDEASTAEDAGADAGEDSGGEGEDHFSLDDGDTGAPFDMDCREALVDSFWGDASVGEEDRVAIFDDIWQKAADKFAGFQAVDADWDVVGEEGRAAAAAATSAGRFYQILSDLFLTLGDGHNLFLDRNILGFADADITDIWEHSAPFRPALEDRPPLFWLEDRVSTIGACVTLAADGESLVVYSVTSDNPAGLAPGDRIVGYDGATWRRILPAIDACALPVWGRTASNDASRKLQRLQSVVNNPHLFDHLDVVRRGASAAEEIPTEGLLDYESGVFCSDRLPVDGVTPPCTDWFECFGDNETAANVSWGRLPGTNIGYIDIYSWYGNESFQQAVSALWETDGIILDQRGGVGGIMPEAAALSLFDGVGVAITDAVRASADDYFSLVGAGWECCSDGIALFYDHPIAVLTGPKMGSAGDLFPYIMSLHPRARRFGRTTDGRFSTTGNFVWPSTSGSYECGWDPYSSSMSGRISEMVFLSAAGENLFGSIQTPESPVWLTEDDISAGVDTVVEAALAWIESEQ